MNNLIFAPAVEIARAIQERKISCVEMLELYLKRIELHNPKINAIVGLDIEGARKRASDADIALDRGETWGPLHGVPITIKDAYEVMGMPTTSGAEALKNYKARQNAPAAQRLIDAGAIIFGKTNLPFYAGDIQTYNTLHGVTNNPWDLEKTCGGSSGGAAAALAAGLTSLELGSDLGGSIRNPAHYNGVYGHKASYGIIPLRGHIPGPPGTLSAMDLGVAGPLARNAKDLELAMDILSGPDRLEKKGWRLQLPSSNKKKLSDFKVAVWFQASCGPIDKEVEVKLDQAVGLLESAGVHIKREVYPDIDVEQSRETYLMLLNGLMAAGFPSKVLAKFDELAAGATKKDSSYQSLLIAGCSQKYRDWLGWNEKREQLRMRWEEFFQNYDLLLCPVMPTVAYPHDHKPVGDRNIEINGSSHFYMDQVFWAGVPTVANLPATVVPLGLSSSGLPVGMQIVAPYLEDKSSIRFAQLMENVVGGFTTPPGFQ
ncbi:MAG: amidase [Proteobacteria bacterium]|nr:amidase [Pseudomonadota bacterium]